MKRQRINYLSIFLLLFSVVLTSCDINSLSSPSDDVSDSSNGSISENEVYTVTFDSDGGTSVPTQEVEDGNKLIAPDATYKYGHTFAGWYQENEKWLFDEFVVTSNITLKAHWLQSNEVQAFNMPIISVELEESELSDVTREDYVAAQVSVTNDADHDDIISAKAEMRGRGHGSWTFPKKGYRIKFDKKVSLFGAAKSKHWVLVAGAHDQSLVRHNIAYTITNDVLDNIEYQTSVNEVELYVNGNYEGVYSLFEHIRVDKDRVNIESEYGVLDTGYLIEYDAYAKDDGGTEGIDYFDLSELKYPFSIKSPDPDDYEKEGLNTEEYRYQIMYIESYVRTVVQAILNHDFARVTELIDLPSFIDTYLIHELFKNTDTGWGSLYFVKKPGGKLYGGPVWDFDLSSGLSRGDKTTTGLYVSDTVREHSPATANELFIALMEIEAFVTLFKERFLSVSEAINESLANYETKIAAYNVSYMLDAQRWTNGQDKWQSEQEKVFTWLRDRTFWLKHWAQG